MGNTLDQCIEAAAAMSPRLWIMLVPAGLFWLW
jgi:hypothetical protein